MGHVREALNSIIEVDYPDPHQARRAQTLNAFVVASVPVAVLTAALVLPFVNGVPSAVFLVLAAVGLSVSAWLTHKHRLTAATWLFALMLLMVTVGQPLLTGDLSTNAMLIPLCTVMLVYVFPVGQWYVVAGWVIASLALLGLGTTDADTELLPGYVWLLNAALATLLTVLVVMYAARQFTASVRREHALASQLSAREAVLHRLEELANSDPLTGFLNRRSLPSLFAATPQHTALALIDLDNFKSINDDHSHAAGDDVLVFVSGLVAGRARPDDLLFRLGGDEFLVVRPHADAQQLAEWLRALREAMRDHAGPRPLGMAQVSFSAGVVARTTSDIAHMLTLADAALYRAKQQGRDAIVVG